MDAVDTATYHVKTREGTHSMTMLISAIIIPDPSDVLAQVFGKNIEKNPDNWSDPRFEELIVAQEIELDTDKRAAIFTEMVEILRKGESHWVPLNWQKPGGAMDCHIQNYVVPMTIQLANKFEHIWWDESAC
jgi:ABC-type transport system substrate-binding protein